MIPKRVKRYCPKPGGRGRTNECWDVWFEPVANVDMHVWFEPTVSCQNPHSVCTEDGRMLETNFRRKIKGPPRIRVYDTWITEGPNAELSFLVNLTDGTRHSGLTMDYTTSDGTATAGADYTHTSGTLTLAPNQTNAFIIVPVIDDEIDEGAEDLTLTLSNVSDDGIWMRFPEATGTINNHDRMPTAWLARFGRTAATQVMDAVEDRLSAPGAAGSSVTLAGHALAGASDEDLKALEERENEARFDAFEARLRGERPDDDNALGTSETPTGSALLTSSAFTFTGGTPEGGYASFWGRGAQSRFDGREGDLTLEGEVTSAMLGADFSRDTGTVGLMLSHSSGEGSYQGEGEGEVESTLTGLYPYGRYALNDRVSLWGLRATAKGR